MAFSLPDFYGKSGAGCVLAVLHAAVTGWGGEWIGKMAVYPLSVGAKGQRYIEFGGMVCGR